MIRREALKQLSTGPSSHSTIVFNTIFSARKEFLLVYEYKIGGTLRERLATLPISLPYRRRIALAHNIAQGLNYLHNVLSPSVVHRDIKTSNIMLDEWQVNVSFGTRSEHRYRITVNNFCSDI